MPKLSPINYKKLIKVFEIEGFHVSRKHADHIIMTKLGIKRPLVIKTSPKNVPITHIMTNLNSAGISRERFFELLEMI